MLSMLLHWGAVSCGAIKQPEIQRAEWRETLGASKVDQERSRTRFIRCRHQRDPRAQSSREGLSSDPLQTSASQAADTGERHLGSLPLELRAPNRSHEPGASASVGEATLATNELFGTLRFYWVNIQGTLNLGLVDPQGLTVGRISLKRPLGPLF